MRNGLSSKNGPLGAEGPDEQQARRVDHRLCDACRPAIQSPNRRGIATSTRIIRGLGKASKLWPTGEKRAQEDRKNPTVPCADWF